jgi:hypothetical protein
MLAEGLAERLGLRASLFVKISLCRAIVNLETRWVTA